MDYALAIDKLRPGAKWATAEDYADLKRTWSDDSELPTDAQLQAAYAEAAQEIAAKDQLKADIGTDPPSRPAWLLAVLTPLRRDVQRWLERDRVDVAIEVINQAEPPSNFSLEHRATYNNIRQNLLNKLS